MPRTSHRTTHDRANDHKRQYHQADDSRSGTIPAAFWGSGGVRGAVDGVRRVRGIIGRVGIGTCERRFVAVWLLLLVARKSWRGGAAGAVGDRIGISVGVVEEIDIVAFLYGSI